MLFTIIGGEEKEKMKNNEGIGKEEK